MSVRVRGAGEQGGWERTSLRLKERQFQNLEPASKQILNKAHETTPIQQSQNTAGIKATQTRQGQEEHKIVTLRKTMEILETV